MINIYIYLLYDINAYHISIQYQCLLNYTKIQWDNTR